MTASLQRSPRARLGLRVLSWSLIGTGVAAMLATCSERDADDKLQVSAPSVEPEGEAIARLANDGGNVPPPPPAPPTGEVDEPNLEFRRRSTGSPSSVPTTSTARGDRTEGSKFEHRRQPSPRWAANVAPAPEEYAEEEAPDDEAPALRRAYGHSRSAAKKLKGSTMGMGSGAMAPAKSAGAIVGVPHGVPGGIVGGVPGDDQFAAYDRKASDGRQRRAVERPTLPSWTDTQAKRPANPEALRWQEHMVTVAEDPQSTFSIDVDTASYARARSQIEQGFLPGTSEVRVEEMINYFNYEYERPDADTPVAIYTEVGPCPWNQAHKLVHVGLAAKEVEQAEVPARNLVFLLDVSGSMSSPERLPLLKQALSMLVPDLREQDRVAIVVYAGAAGAVLEPTSGAHQDEILRALDRLESGGSTNGSDGIKLAYELAHRHRMPEAINRVILATDGDFNVGTTDRDELVDLVARERGSGIYLSVLGFGVGSHQDGSMEQLADKGNGNYAYIDTLDEARKVLVQEGGSTIVPVADDVKIQVEFDRAHVESYRLVGYDNRRLAHRDFADDRKDAGEMGSGHTVTALYEVVPRLSTSTSESSESSDADHLLDVRVRYKNAGSTTSKLLERGVRDREITLSETSEVFRFSAAVAEFGQLLRGYEFPHGGFPQVLRVAENARSFDPHCHRAGFLDVAAHAAILRGHAEFASRSRTDCRVGDSTSAPRVVSSEPAAPREMKPADDFPVPPSLSIGADMSRGFSPLNLLANYLEALAGVLRTVPTGLALMFALGGAVLYRVSQRRSDAP